MKKFSPKSSGGKVFCIFYGLIGIPICGVFLATTSDYFSNSFLHLYERRRHKLQKDKWHDIFIAAVIFLLPGLAVFLFIPAAIFTYLEVRTNFYDHSRCIFWTYIELLLLIWRIGLTWMQHIFPSWRSQRLDLETLLWVRQKNSILL